MKKDGKILTIFLVVFTVVLLSLTVITFFFFREEKTLKEAAEIRLAESRTQGMKLEVDLKEARKQNYLLEEKNKEADERINSLLDDLELEEGLREELKREVLVLKESLENENKTRQQLREQYEGELNIARTEITNLRGQLDSERKQSAGLNDAIARLQGDFEKLKQEQMAAARKLEDSRKEQSSKDVNIKQIVVNPPENIEGKILNIDLDNDFVIFNLGSRDGVAPGMILSVYRKSQYLGDIKVSRVQTEMSAADLVQPFPNRTIRKDDQVVPKQ